MATFDSSNLQQIVLRLSAALQRQPLDGSEIESAWVELSHVLKHPNTDNTEQGTIEALPIWSSILKINVVQAIVDSLEDTLYLRSTPEDQHIFRATQVAIICCNNLHTYAWLACLSGEKDVDNGTLKELTPYFGRARAILERWWTLHQDHAASWLERDEYLEISRPWCLLAKHTDAFLTTEGVDPPTE